MKQRVRVGNSYWAINQSEMKKKEKKSESMNPVIPWKLILS